MFCLRVENIWPLLTIFSYKYLHMYFPQKSAHSSLTVKVLTDTDDLAAYTIQDVVLPQPGFDVVYPANALGDKYKEIMGRDGLDPTKMRNNVK